MALITYRLNNKDAKPMPRMVVVSKDVFSMEYLYFMLHEWLIEHKYCTRDSDSAFNETFYEQRDFGGGPREIFIRWRVTKESGNIRFKDPLYYYELDIDMHALGIKPTEVVVKGKKLGADTGEIEVSINARLVTNTKKYPGDTFKKLIAFAKGRPMKSRYSAHKSDLINEMTELQEAVKGYFQIDTYLDEAALEKWYLTRTQENL